MADRKKKAKREYQVPNLRRGIRIMETLAGHPHGMTMSELARALDLPNNSVFRITRTLMELGYLQRDKDSRKVSMTRKLLGIGYSAVMSHSVVEESLEEMRLLRDKTGETVLISTLGELETVILEQIVGTHQFKFFVEPGARLPLHASAHGKVFLAYLPPDEQNAILKKIELTRFNENTLTTRTAIKKECKKIRELHYATDESEQIHGVHCVAAPIRDHRGYPIAAMTITGPETRLSQSLFPEIGRLLVEHTGRISRKFGYDASSATAD